MYKTIKYLFQYLGIRVISLLFLVLALWRVFLFFILSSNTINLNPTSVFWWGASYQLIALVGGFFGLVIAKKWGGFKSLIGKSFNFFSLGLILQSFGQITATYYVLTSGTVPYPAVGDVGFFGSVIFYITGVLFLAKASNVRSSLNSLLEKAQAIMIPLLILAGSYWFFLRDYAFDWSYKIKVFLDFGYPLGQAFYLSIAILVLIVSRKKWGDSMRSPMMFLLIALAAQYSSDFTFLYQSMSGTYVAGGSVDGMYMLSYFLMAFSLVYLGSVFNDIKSENISQNPGESQDVEVNIVSVYNKIASIIIHRQERVAGQIAWEEARKIEGLVVKDQENGVVSLDGEPKKVIDKLVRGYQDIFGELAGEVSKNASRYLVAELSADQVPDSLK